VSMADKNENAPVRMPAQERRLQVVEPTHSQVKRRHAVPGTIPAQMQALIVSEWRGGRSAVQIAKAYNADVAVVLDLVLRDQQRAMGRMRLAA
jgi:hypothetical protein